MNEQEIYERMTSAEQSLKSAHHRIDSVADNGKCITELLVEMKYIRRDLNEFIERVSALESKPANRYDMIIRAVITAIIAAAISFLVK